MPQPSHPLIERSIMMSVTAKGQQRLITMHELEIAKLTLLGAHGQLANVCDHYRASSDGSRITTYQGITDAGVPWAVTLPRS